ncbi:MAG: hypothetical protein HYZ53_04360 [Planctomycetes bacterium]|nr:hypothetical protein [Planctomycetota bacterium]
MSIKLPGSGTLPRRTHARAAFLTLTIVGLAALAAGCGASRMQSVARSSPTDGHGDLSEDAASAESRPGLGTSWGETRHSAIRPVAFERANPTTPTVVATLYYDDREGVEAMAGRLRGNRIAEAAFPVAGIGVTVSLRDGSGDNLPAVHAGPRDCVVGESGSRYVLHFRNRSDLLLEIVASVDGLDVWDGRPASYAKRGYLLRPRGELTIDGWRRSDVEVAAFRFGSVRDSYAARMGSARNVGVIGVAVFHERGANPGGARTEDEVCRRLTADPFPGSKYAQPPPGTRSDDWDRRR